MRYDVHYRMSGEPRTVNVGEAQKQAIAEKMGNPKRFGDFIDLGGGTVIKASLITAIEPDRSAHRSVTAQEPKILPAREPMDEERLRAAWIRCVRTAFATNPRLAEGLRSGNPFASGMRRLIERYVIAPEEAGLPTGTW